MTFPVVKEDLDIFATRFGIILSDKTCPVAVQTKAAFKGYSENNFVYISVSLFLMCLPKHTAQL